MYKRISLKKRITGIKVGADKKKCLLFGCNHLGVRDVQYRENAES